MTLFAELRARKLHLQAQRLSAAGDEEAALAAYRKALQLDPSRSSTAYNMGLIYKYRRAWAESFQFNKLAGELDRSDEATNWNLGIAATALRDWGTARAMWARVGINVAGSEGPIEDNFGMIPVRLNADNDGNREIEVVWAQRLCPARARIANIPTGGTGFRYGDVVLHDGAAVGTRLTAEGKERPVFNVLELFEGSRFGTFEANIGAVDLEAVSALESICDAKQLTMEDWTSSLRSLCKACSEGTPHDHHDTQQASTEWQTARRIGLAAREEAAARAALAEWAAQGDGRVLRNLQCVLRAQPLL
jgi:tetratricopeptide (TPR) repeat protein